MPARDYRGVIIVLAVIGALVYMARLDPNAITMMIVGSFCSVLGAAHQRAKTNEGLTGLSLPPPGGSGGTTVVNIPPMPKAPVTESGPASERMRHAMSVDGLSVLAIMTIVSGIILAISCGTPIAPKEICVQWARVTDGGSFVIIDGGKE